jgi:hypothetical protein
MSSAPAKTKKQAILEVVAGHERTPVTAAELERIRGRVASLLSGSKPVSLDYVARILEQAGFEVARRGKSGAVRAGASDIEKSLRFATLEQAEECLRHFGALLEGFCAAGDSAAAEQVLDAARLGLRRATMIAHNPKVAAHKRRVKEEIAQWFRVWLEMPGAFSDWLALRKNSAEFLHRFRGGGSEGIGGEG